MIDQEKITKETFDNDALIAKLDPDDLIKLAMLADSAEQLDKVANAKNIDYKVVTAIIANSNVPLRTLHKSSILNLIRLSKSNDELCKIIKVANTYGN